MAAGRDHWRSLPHRNERQPHPALLVLLDWVRGHVTADHLGFFALALEKPLPRVLVLLWLLATNRGAAEYLFQMRLAEADPWLADDLQISALTILYAEKGVPSPDVCACYEVLGVHPNQLWNLITERRKSLLGDLYDAWYGAAASSQNSSDLPPRKQPSPASPEILPQKAKVQSA